MFRLGDCDSGVSGWKHDRRQNNAGQTSKG
jgi:hypothetical protein